MQSQSSHKKRIKEEQEMAQAISCSLGGVVIMDTSDGGNLTNAPLLQNLHPKVLGCTLAHFFAPCTDKVHPKER